MKGGGGGGGGPGQEKLAWFLHKCSFFGSFVAF